MSLFAKLVHRAGVGRISPEGNHTTGFAALRPKPGAPVAPVDAPFLRRQEEEEDELQARRSALAPQALAPLVRLDGAEEEAQGLHREATSPALSPTSGALRREGAEEEEEAVQMVRRAAVEEEEDTVQARRASVAETSAPRTPLRRDSEEEEESLQALARKAQGGAAMPAASLGSEASGTGLAGHAHDAAYPGMPNAPFSDTSAFAHPSKAPSVKEGGGMSVPDPVSRPREMPPPSGGQAADAAAPTAHTAGDAGAFDTASARDVMDAAAMPALPATAPWGLDVPRDRPQFEGLDPSVDTQIGGLDPLPATTRPQVPEAVSPAGDVIIEQIDVVVERPASPGGATRSAGSDVAAGLRARYLGGL